jgi:DNA-binding transcriptional regulator YhcF (GntR family)
MILFDKFIMDDSGPIYAQIIRYVKRGIVAGNIGDGDEMPSRRVLSSLLGVNPNTIQKAYRILEDEGIIQSHAGAKSYVVLDPEKVTKIRAELIATEVGAMIGAMKQSGVSKEEDLELISRLWDGGTPPEHV